MFERAEQRDLIERLRRVEGQLSGIQRMVEKGRSCVEILQQVSAARAAINRSSFQILKLHVIARVVPAPRDDARGRRRLDEELRKKVDPFLHR